MAVSAPAGAEITLHGDIAVLFSNQCRNYSKYSVGPWARPYGGFVRYLGFFLLVAFLVALFAACASDRGKADLRNRVKLYWKYKAAGKAGLMYDLEYPVLKNQVDKDTYIRRYVPVIKYRKPTIEAIQIDKDGTTANVQMKVIVAVRPKGIKNTFERPFSIKERWVKADDGAWYHVPKSLVKRS